MFLDHAIPDTRFRLEEREKCEVLYTLVPVFSMIMSGSLFSS